MAAQINNVTSTQFASIHQKQAEISAEVKKLESKILDRSATVGVIGLGYVGLPLTVTFNKGGFDVIGFEKSTEKVDFLQDGVSYIQDVESSDVKKYIDTNKFAATVDFKKLSECDIVVICVPTPLAKSQDPDMSYIVAALSAIEENFKSSQLVILESTTYPGTTKEVMLPRLEDAGTRLAGRKFECGSDFFLAFSPERVDPGNATFNTFNTPKVVGGITEGCGHLASLFYAQCLEKVVRVSSPESAEMVKLLENTFRAVNIGLVNEVAIMSEKLGIDVWEVIEAASTKPFGYMPFYPGPGLGGHCIPIDPSYLSWKLRTLNYNARFIELANNVNRSMPDFCVEKVVHALNLDKKSVNGSKLLIMGVAYKKDIDDLRESPAIDIIKILKEKGAEISYHDPFIPEINYQGLELKSKAWSPEIAKDYDAVIVTTDHTAVDYGTILNSASRIVDTRNAFKNFKSDKVVKL